MKITAVLLKLGQRRVIISPMSPKITAKREKRAREREREKKRLSTVFSFYSVDFGEKTSAEGHSKTLSQSDLVFINPGTYIYICVYLSIYIFGQLALSNLKPLPTYPDHFNCKCALGYLKNTSLVYPDSNTYCKNFSCYIFLADLSCKRRSSAVEPI